MRREISIVPWLFALITLIIAYWHAIDAHNKMDILATDYHANSEIYDDAFFSVTNAISESDFEADGNSNHPFRRPLFTFNAIESQLPNPSPEPRIDDIPALKGLIARDGVGYAIFTGQPGTDTGYSAIGVGETYRGYTVLRIDREEVVTTSPDGGEVVFRLRGNGETP